MDAEEAVTIGARLRRIRKARDKSLRVVAGLAGIGYGHLSDIENGKAPLDSLSLIIALAGVLQVAPSELTRVPVPAPGNGHTDSTVEAVRLALDAVDAGRPGGMVVPVGVLRDRVTEIVVKRRASRFAEVATDLPGLIADLHTTLDTGRSHGELLDLVAQLHVHATRLWLRYVGAPTDLERRAVFLARNLAREREEVGALGVATFGVADVLLTAGSLKAGRAELDSLTLPPTTADNAGFVCYVTVSHAVAAAVEGRAGDVTAPMEAAAELAQRFGNPIGEADSLGFVFDRSHVAMNRMWLALDAGEPDRAVSVAADAHPERHPFTMNRADSWTLFGRAAARLRDRRGDAVRAFLTAEDLFPARIYRDPFARDAIAGLLEHPPQGRIGEDLRGLAWRTGLDVA